MATSVTEKFGSRLTREGDDPRIDLVYTIKGTDSDISAKTLLYATAPATYDGLVRRTWEVEQISEQLWEGTVSYGLMRARPDVGDSMQSFETGGGTQHITQSLSTIGSYAPAGKTAPDFKGAIGATRDSVEGVDIQVPVFQFSESHVLPDRIVTDAYKLNLYNLIAKVNQAAFRWFAAGEVLFMGASGNKRGEDDWEVTFRFAASPNKTGQTVGDITGIAKLGWDYLWVLYEDAEDATADWIVKQPLAAYVERVYEQGDFGLLLI